MYGENQEAEYGGDISKAFKPTRDVKDFDKYYFLEKMLNFGNLLAIKQRFKLF